MATMLWYDLEEDVEFQRQLEQDEMDREDPVSVEMRIARNMLVGRTHHRALIAQNRTLIEIKRELDHNDPRKREIHELIGKINTKLAQSKLDTANKLIDGIRFEFTAIGRALRENDFFNAREWINWSTLQSLRRQLFEAPAWLVNAIEEVTGATYGSALQSFNETIAAAQEGLARREAEKKAADIERARITVEFQRQNVRNAALIRMDAKLVEKCRAELSRIKASIESGNVDAASSMLVKYRIDIRDRDLILAVEGRNPVEVLGELDQAIIRKRQETRT